MQYIYDMSDEKLKFDDVCSLSALVYELSNIEPILSRREYLKFFSANARNVKKYKQFFIDAGYYFTDDEIYAKYLEEDNENYTNNDKK